MLNEFPQSPTSDMQEAIRQLISDQPVTDWQEPLKMASEDPAIENNPITKIIASHRNIESLRAIFLSNDPKYQSNEPRPENQEFRLRMVQNQTESDNLNEDILEKRQLSSEVQFNEALQDLLETERFDSLLVNSRLARIQNQENSYINIRPIDEAHRALVHSDKYPLLKFRRLFIFEVLMVQLYLRKIVMHFLFEFISLAVIVANTVLYIIDASRNYAEGEQTLSDRWELTFLIIFTIELAMKLIAYGIFTKNPFYRSPWNIFDTVIIIISWLSYSEVNGLDNYTFFRALRILRVYRILSSSKQLKLKISNFFYSINYFLEIFLILFFFYSIFAIMGLMIFSGVVQQRCVDQSNPSEWIVSEQLCFNSAVCPMNLVCMSGFQDPNSPITHFDNFFTSMFVTFQITFLEGWYSLMTRLIGAFPGYIEPIIYLYFVLVIFIGNLFVLNLIKAVIIVKYNQSEKIIKNERFQKKTKLLEDEELNLLQLKVCQYFENIFYIANAKDASITLYRAESIRKNTWEGLEENLVTEFTRNNNIDSESHQNLMRSPTRGRIASNTSITVYSERNVDSVNEGSSRNTSKRYQTKNIQHKIGLENRPAEFGILSIAERMSMARQARDNDEEIRRRSLRTIKMSLSNMIKTNSLKEEEATLLALLQNEEAKKSSYYKLLKQWKKQKVKHIKMEISNNSGTSSYYQFYSKYDVLPSQEINQAERIFYHRSLKTIKVEYNFDLVLFERADKIINMHYLKSDSSFNIAIIEKMAREIKYKDLRSAYTSVFGTVDDLSSVEEKHSKFYRNIQQCLDKYYYLPTDQKASMFIPLKPYEEVKHLTSIKKQINDRVLKSRLSKISISDKNMRTFFKREFQAKEKPNTDISRLNLSNQIIYSSILDYDYMIQKKVSRVWSGFDALNSKKIFVEKMGSIIDRMNVERKNIWRNGFIGKVQSYREKVKIFMESDFVTYLVLLFVVMNTVVLCLYGFVSEDREYILDGFNTAFTIIFIVEFVLKLFGLGFSEYFKQGSNVLDAIVVIFSIVELFSDSKTSSSTAVRALRLLRIFRVIKIVRLLRYLRFINVIMHVLYHSWSKLRLTLALVTTFIIMFSLIGFGLFKGTLDKVYSDGKKAQNFDNLYESISYVFNILTLDNWNDYLNVLLNGDQSFAVSLIYYFTWTFIGSILVLNLFLAAVLEGFSEPSTIDIIKELSKEEKTIIIIFESKVKMMTNESTFKKITDKIINKFKTFDFNKINLPFKAKRMVIRNLVLQQNFKLDMGDDNENYDVDDDIEIENEQDQDEDKPLTTKLSVQGSVTRLRRICPASLYLFTPQSCIRKYAIKIANNIWFQRLIILIIILSCALFATLSYRSSFDQNTIDVLEAFDQLFNVLLIVEFIIKVIAFGFIFCEFCYARDAWGLFDFIVVIFVIVDLAIKDSSYRGSWIRIIRVTRVFRLISHVEYFQGTLRNLYDSFSAIGNVLIIILLYFLIYAILGVSFLRNRMNYCADSNDNILYDVNKADCLARNLSWKTYDWNFDNIINGLITLFVVSFLDNWQMIMFSAADSSENNAGAIYRNIPAIYIYFISFVMLVVFIIFNLGIGVIYAQFQIKEEEKRKEINELHDSEQRWMLFMQMIPKTLPNFIRIKVTKSRFGRWMIRVYNSPYFKVTVRILIVVSVVILALRYYNMPKQFELTLEAIQIFISCLFIAEAAMKIYVQGHLYFFNKWYIFEFCLVLLSVIDIILFIISRVNPDLEYAFQLFKITRIIRIFRLFQITNISILYELDKIVRTLIITIPSIVNILVILVLIYFTYAVLGVTAFPDSDIPELENFGVAFLNMFRFSTGESWSLVMWQLNKQYPFWGTIFFVSFIFIASYLLFNMFILISIDQFSIMFFNPKSSLNTFHQFLEQFNRMWAIFTESYGSLEIKENQLYDFFISMKIPLGFNSTGDKFDKLNMYNKENFSVDPFYVNLRIKEQFILNKISNLGMPVTKSMHVKYHFVLFASLKLSNELTGRISNDKNKKFIKGMERKTLQKLSRLKLNSDSQGIKYYATPKIKRIFLKALFTTWESKVTNEERSWIE